jgi:NAD(P)-dependent dehydrogenase (short-subunit alcohol dehydrogenase family)
VTHERTLTGRTALVTGAASGIGRAIALRLAAHGAAVAALDVDGAGAASVATEITTHGGACVALTADVASGPAVRDAVAKARTTLGPVHVLVNNAGICTFLAFVDLAEAEWDRMFAVHVKGAFHCTKAALPDMIAAGWGRIVNVSSVGGLKGSPALTHYASAKAALVGFTRALATEVGMHGVTVNAIAPGLIDTPLLVRSRMPETIRRAQAAELPVRRIGVPEDVAAACAYLVSPDAGYVTGQVLSPNGGGHTW